MSGNTGGWDWFGHTGGFQGYISRTCAVPARDLAITILTNSTDGWAGLWLDGAIHILRSFAERGVPDRRIRDWTGRWWSQWGAVDLVPIGNIVIAAVPGAINPFMDASEIEISSRDAGKISVEPATAVMANRYGRIRARERALAITVSS